MENLITINSFFLTCLIIGIVSGRGTNTFKTFSVGERNFSTTTLVLTLLATMYGGSFLASYLELTYTNGLYIYNILPTTTYQHL